MSLSALLIEAMERKFLPDFIIRKGIQNLCQERLESLKQVTLDLQEFTSSEYYEALRHSPLAVHTDEANQQHYEVPAEFFNLALGKNKKYSSAFWSEDCKNLNDAEDHALTITMERAEISDGMKILELGCGWGSLTLAMAKKFPNSEIVAVSNSNSQREWIEKRAKELGNERVKILTRNIIEVKDFEKEFGKFDRVVSVEMFEHLRNYEVLFERISKTLNQDGKLFFHVFSHRDSSYFFETEGEDNWMGKYFFTGGQMPAHTLFSRFQKDLYLEKQWAWNGTHYAKTARAWLENTDQNALKIQEIFKVVYGEENAARWLQRWRVFFISCEELFQFENGNQWGVSHYLFKNRGGRS